MPLWVSNLLSIGAACLLGRSELRDTCLLFVMPMPLPLRGVGVALLFGGMFTNLNFLSTV